MLTVISRLEKQIGNKHKLNNNNDKTVSFIQVYYLINALYGM